VLCALIAGYAAVITRARVSELPDRRAVIALMFVWLLAVLAIGLIARSWVRSRARGAAV
jgi:hypothetical protein